MSFAVQLCFCALVVVSIYTLTDSHGTRVSPSTAGRGGGARNATIGAVEFGGGADEVDGGGALWNGNGNRKLVVGGGRTGKGKWRRGRRAVAIKCHNCRGGSCVTVDANPAADDNDNCENMCCVAVATFGSEGYKWYRKCDPTHRESGKCLKQDTSSFCHHIATDQSDDVIHCGSCDTDYCNNENMPAKFECHKCTNCNTIPDSTLKPCMAPECCYFATVQDTPNKPYFAKRGCMEWKKDLDCSTTCHAQKNLHAGPWDKCKTCETGASSGCNNEIYKPPEIVCYQCDSCPEIQATMTPVPCQELCCYTHVSYGKDGWVVKRGCAKEMRTCGGDPVDEYCAYHTQNFPVTNLQLVHCKSCGQNECNNKLQQAFQCYKCSGVDCDKVVPSKHLEHCLSPQCCYTAHIKNADGEFYAERGCMKWSINQKCTKDDTCKSVVSKHTGESVIFCNTCQEGAKEGCNNELYVPPLTCYNCTGDDCNKVSQSTPLIECQSRCCYEATLFSSKSGQTNIRGCAEPTRKCSEYCDDHKTTIQPKSLAFNCIPCETHKCNKGNLRARFKCNSCSKTCNIVDANNNNPIDCIEPACCYTAIRQDSPFENFYAYRGCARFHTNWTTCEDACSIQQEDFTRSHPHGTFGACHACKNLEDGCNKQDHIPEAACIKCDDKDCYKVDAQTTTRKCQQQLCYSITTITNIHINNKRDCMEKPSCDTFYEDCKKEPTLVGTNVTIHCECCDRYKCNRERLTKPLVCYTCNHCDSAESQAWVHCRSSSCCFTAYMRDSKDEPFYANRGCGVWSRVHGCRSLTLELEQEHYTNHPEGEFIGLDVCERDADDYCNNKPFDPSSMAMPPYPSGISCYACRHCDIVTIFTRTVRCMAGECCYRAVVRDKPNEVFFAIRGCIRVLPGHRCEDACAVVERRHLWAFPTGTVRVCITCDARGGDGCNYAHLVHRNRQTGDVGPIRCYACTGCDVVISTTPNKACRSSGCCFAAIVKDDSTKDNVTIRGCDESASNVPCDDTCKHLEDKHVVRYCIACNHGAGHNCNNYPLIPNAHDRFGEVTVEPPVAANCYNCTDCSILTIDTPTEWCADIRCCFQAQVRKDLASKIFVVRGCQKMPKGEHCNAACEQVTIEHVETHQKGYVRVCRQCSLYAHVKSFEKCNDISAKYTYEVYEEEIESVTVKCYQCRNCTTIPEEVGVVDCQSAGCCYVAHVRDDAFSPYHVTRGCSPFKQGRGCIDACTHANNAHMWVHPFGEMDQCYPCHPIAGNYCNKFRLYIRPSSTTHPQLRRINTETLKCFACTNCYTINMDTPLIECTSHSCCYTAILQTSKNATFTVSRGCSTTSHVSGVCQYSCEKVRADHMWFYPKGILVECMVCGPNDTHECNSQPFSAPPIESIPTPEVTTCYECTNCHTVKVGVTPTTDCQYPKVCYSASLVDRVGRTTIRGCENGCDTLMESYPDDTVHNCMICTSNWCNYMDITASITANGIECYNCEGCNEIRASTPKVTCTSPHCCYLVVRNATVFRGCNTRTQCSETCDHQRSVWKDARYCSSCDEADLCNDETYSSLG